MTKALIFLSYPKKWPIAACLAILAGCSCQQAERETLPRSSGKPGSIYVVMGAPQWRGSLGGIIDSLFSVEVPGLPRPEPTFDIQWIDPKKLNYILKRHRNLIFLFTLDNKDSGVRIIKNLFSEESLKDIQHNVRKYATAVTDLYANNQEVVYLYGKTEQQLLTHLRRQGQQLVRHFEKREEKRLLKSLLKGKHIKGISKWLKKHFRCTIKIPVTYKLVETADDFLWARQINPKSDKNIFIAWTNYTSRHQLEEQALIDFRNRVCKKYLFEDPERANSYLTTETTIPFIPVTIKKVQLNSQYAIKISGLWRTNNFSMGGPFIGYAVIDSQNGKMYYIEGFVFSPGESQRETIRQLKVLLSTFTLEKSQPRPTQ